MQLPGFLQWLAPKRQQPDELPTASIDPRVDPEAQAAVAERQALPEPTPDKAPLAPYPSVDRYPTILGSAVTLAYISSVFRLALTGYRREFVDVLDELLERDPHMYAVVAQRVHAVAGGRIQVIPAETEQGSGDEVRAQELADLVKRRIGAIPDFQQSVAQLQWGGLFYGVGASEISWRQDEDGWYPARLHWIHSRRLAYPDATSWSVRIWDQGMVSSWGYLEDPTGRLFGIKCDDFPGKFLVHTPSVRGNYPTRDGLGREMAYWSALKLMGARGASQYVERFGKPWTAGYYTTGDDGHPRAANEEDIKALEAAGRALGIGSLAHATLPDSTKLDIFGPAAFAPGSNLIHAAFVAMCNAEISKAGLGQTDTVEAGPNGSRAATEVRKSGTYELYRYDAACMSETLHYLARWIVRLNAPEDERLTPKVILHAAEAPDPDALVKRAATLADAGAPVDADELGELTGVPMLPATKPGENPQGRRLYKMAPLKPYEVQSLRRLDAGETLETPAKPIQPSAEVNPAEAGTAAAGATESDS